MAIRFRFRNAREVHSVPVTGSGISLKDLKAAIITQRGLGDDRRPVDLLVFDARSRIQLVDEEAQVLRNSVLEVTLASAVASAAPLGNAANTTAIQQAAGAQRGPRLFGSRGKGIRAGDNVVREDTSHADALLGKEELAAATGADDTTGGYEVDGADEESGPAGKGKPGRGRRGAVPEDLVCHVCDAVGDHWPQNCPLAKDARAKAARKGVGLPLSLITVVDRDTVTGDDGSAIAGALLTTTDDSSRVGIWAPSYHNA